MKTLIKFALPLAGAALTAAPAFAQDFAQGLAGPPRPPVGASPNQAIPERDSFGRYATPNQDLSSEETVWHLRAALNVAALACRDAEEAETIAAYGHMLAQDGAPLAAADAAVKARYRARYGPAWADRHDRDMTRLYNFFAQPTAQAGFCVAAHHVLAEVGQVAPEQLSGFAAEALPRLEAPFTDFYRDYDRYRAALAAWREQRMPAEQAPDAPLTIETASTAGMALP